MSLMMGSLTAHAQLRSIDGGAAAIDGNGLMWANTVGVNLSYSLTGTAGSAQAWIAGLNASNYGGYNNWTLASGNGGDGSNTTTDQLGELFYTDCGNSAGTATVLNNSARNCTALSALTSAITSNPRTPGAAIFFSSSPYSITCGGKTCGDGPYWWVYQTPGSNQQGWNSDTVFDGVVGLGDAVAVRRAPEIDSGSAAGGLTLLCGILAVLRGRRARNAQTELSM